MTPDDLDATMRILQQVFPRRFGPEHVRSLRDQFERFPIDAEQAGAALRQAWAAHGKFASPQKIVKALSVAAYGEEGHRVSRKAEDREAQRRSEMEHKTLVSRDDADTLRWLESIDQADIDATLAYVRVSNPVFAAALGGPVTLDRLRECQGLRGAFHAAARATALE